MTLSFHSRLLSGELAIPALLDDLQDTGIEAVEPATSLFSAREDLEEAFEQAVRERDLAMPCYDALGNLALVDEVDRQRVKHGLQRDLERCARWGIPKMMIAGSRLDPRLSPENARRLIAEGMNALVDEADEAGIELLIESFGVEPTLHASSDDLDDVLHQCDPRIRTTFDMGNFVLGGDPPAELVEHWFERIGHVHVKDFRRLGGDEEGGLTSRHGHHYRGCRLGDGVVRVDEVIGKLRRLGYTGALSLEMGGADGMSEVAEDLGRLKGWAEA